MMCRLIMSRHPRAIFLASAILVLCCVTCRGKPKEAPQGLSAIKSETGAKAKPSRANAGTPSATNRARMDAGLDACSHLKTCCNVLDDAAQGYCDTVVQNNSNLKCALSYHWESCPSFQLPDFNTDVAACFRQGKECYSSLLDACRAAGCEKKRGVHGCMVTGDENRHVYCGNW